MKVILILDILAVYGVVHSKGAVNKWECDKVAMMAIISAMNHCEIPLDFIQNFVTGALHDQSSQVKISTENKTNFRSKRDFGGIKIPDNWNSDIGNDFDKGGEPLTPEEMSKILEDKLACFEEEVEENPFCSEIFEECKQKLADPSQKDKENTLGCFFGETCERCPEFVELLMTNLPAMVG